MAASPLPAFLFVIVGYYAYNDKQNDDPDNDSAHASHLLYGMRIPRQQQNSYLYFMIWRPGSQCA
jgi:hypothetical protein